MRAAPSMLSRVRSFLGHGVKKCMTRTLGFQKLIEQCFELSIHR